MPLTGPPDPSHGHFRSLNPHSTNAGLRGRRAAGHERIVWRRLQISMVINAVLGLASFAIVLGGFR